MIVILIAANANLDLNKLMDFVNLFALLIKPMSMEDANAMMEAH
jgi:hypothetical protein